MNQSVGREIQLALRGLNAVQRRAVCLHSQSLAALQPRLLLRGQRCGVEIKVACGICQAIQIRTLAGGKLYIALAGGEGRFPAGEHPGLCRQPLRPGQRALLSKRGCLQV